MNEAHLLCRQQSQLHLSRARPDIFQQPAQLQAPQPNPHASQKHPEAARHAAAVAAHHAQAGKAARGAARGVATRL